MFSTTLRIDEDLGHFLQEAARRSALSVNAFLAELLRREQVSATRRRLAKDWGAYAQDAEAQDVSHALQAQAQVVAKPPAKVHRTKSKAKSKAAPSKAGRSR